MSATSPDPETSGYIDDDIMVDHGPFGYQLVHGDPVIDEFIKASLAAGHRPTSYQNYIANPTPGLMFYPTQSSSGYHVNGLPIESLPHVNTNPHKLWIRYGQYGFLEVNDKLFAHICPADLANRNCTWDEIWCWDPVANKWRGGCQMLRLCQVRSPRITKQSPPCLRPTLPHITNTNQILQKSPQPAPPALTPFQYSLHVSEHAHDALTTVRHGDPSITVLFTTASPSFTTTTTPTFCLPLLGSTARHDWPIIMHAAVSPMHPAHANACVALHNLSTSCFSLRPPTSMDGRNGFSGTPRDGRNGDGSGGRARGGKRGGKKNGKSNKKNNNHNNHNNTRNNSYPTEQQYHCTKTTTCPHGHDFASARVESFAREREHARDAERLVRMNKAVRCQRFGEEVKVWVFVEGWRDEWGWEGRFVFDGKAEVRREWDVRHTLGWCRGCNPRPEVGLGDGMEWGGGGEGEGGFGTDGVVESKMLSAWEVGESGKVVDDEVADDVWNGDELDGQVELVEKAPWDDVEGDLMRKWKEALDLKKS